MSTAVLRTGVDIVNIDRLARMIEASGRDYLETGWTPTEREYCVGRPDRYAARWAAKEAAMKALGKGLGAVGPLDVEVRSSEGGPPALLLHGPAAALAESQGLRDWSLSMTHEGCWAIAFVVAMGSVNDD